MKEEGQITHASRDRRNRRCEGSEAGMLPVQKPSGPKDLNPNVSGERRRRFGFDSQQYGEPMEVCVLS